jgi:nucleotide-binding universal stress UspA family protein
MQKILIPVDGSSYSDLAVQHAALAYCGDPAAQIHLCNVQPNLYRHISKFLSKKSIGEWRKERSDAALASASRYLTQKNIPFSSSFICGEAGTAILQEARDLNCQRIVLGTSKKNIFSRILESSTTAKLLEKSDIPVEIISGKALSPLKQWSIPVLSAGAATALLAIAID